MTRKTFSLALAYFFAVTAQAEFSYYNGQYEYRPEYYTVPPPGYTSPTPRHPQAYAYSTGTYNPDGTVTTTTTTTTTTGGTGSSGPDFMADWQRYFRAGIGPTLFEDTHLTRFGVPANDHVRFKPGVSLDAAAGYAFTPNISADLEVGFIGAQVDHINFFTFDHANYYNLPILINAIGSLPLKDGRIVPYIGAGLGGSVAIFDTQNFTTPANPTISGTEATLVFASQIFIGARFQVKPNLWLGAEYRYFVTDDPTWDYSTKFGMKAPSTHSLMFTLLWKF